MRKTVAKKTIAALSSMMLACGMFVGCGTGAQSAGGSSAGGSSPASESAEPVNLVWYYPGNAGSSSNEAVFAAANELIAQKLPNTTVEFIPIDFGSYDEKMRMIIAGGEDYDICWTSNWLNNYNQNVSNKAFAELDELLPEYAPNLWAQVDPKIWEGTRVNGKIYAIPNEQIMARSTALAFPKELVDEVGFDYTSVKTLEDLEPYLAAVHEKYPEKNVLGKIWQDLALYYGFEEFLGNYVPGAIRIADGEVKVINQFESEEWASYINLRKRWNELGYTQKDLITADDYTNAQVAMESPFFVTTYTPGVEVSFERNYGYPVYIHQIADPLLTTGGITATLQAVSVNSENKERAVQLLELVNTDAELFNLLCYGLEEQHYTLDANNVLTVTEGSDYGNASWVMGCTYNGYLLDGEPADKVEATKALNSEAVASPLLGFSPVLDNVKSQMNNANSAIAEYIDTLEQGVGDTETVNQQLLEKLKAADVDGLIAEMQSQIDAWLSAK